jgi:hypothetical protein
VGDIQLPLKERYLKMNDTLEGRTAAMRATTDDDEAVPEMLRKLTDNPFAPIENVDECDHREDGQAGLPSEFKLAQTGASSSSGDGMVPSPPSGCEPVGTGVTLMWAKVARHLRYRAKMVLP